KNPNPNIGPVCEILQPAMHGPPCQWECNEQCNSHQFQKIARQHRYNITHRSAQHLPDPDFLNTLFSGISYQAEKSQAGHEYGQYCKADTYSANPHFRLVNIVEIVIHKGI